jgi:adenine/guanine phosphoribosyltransferase-like PRPP-binding protein
MAGTEPGVEQLRGLIRSIPDFPRPGIVFRDVTRLGAGFVPARREGKLPASTERAAYELEHGAAELHVPIDAIRPAPASSSTTT